MHFCKGKEFKISNLSLKSQHKFIRNSLENLKQENILVILVPKIKCHSMTAAVSPTQTRTWSRNTVAHTQTSPLFYTLNVRRPGVESIAWSHFSTKAHVLRPPMRLWKMTWGRATVTCVNMWVSRRVRVQILLTGEADSPESAQNEARTNKRSSYGDI